MFSSIRKHFSYANIVVTLALVFAMSGGAYAAKHYLITSTKQISPKVIKVLQGKPGPTGSVGPQGSAGAQGPAGVKGEMGAAGATGEKGQPGESVSMKAELKGTHCKEGGENFTVAGKTEYACNGEKGATGSPWTAGGTLPNGSTETGVWAEPKELIYANNQTQFMVASLSFPIPLAASLPSNSVHYIKPGEAPPAGCRGSVEKPEAERGNLCVFASIEIGSSLTTIAIENPETAAPGEAGAAKEGALIFFEFAEPEEGAVFARGTWAVTG